MVKKRKSLRFGLMINSLNVEQWQHDTIRLLMDNGMKLSLIIQKADSTFPFSITKKNKNKSHGHFLYRLWNRFLFHPRSKFPINIDKLTDGIPTIFCAPRVIRGISYFNEMDIQEIRNQNLDFILQLGFDIVAGEVINTTKYGVWKFNHGDSFWRYMRGKHSNSVILQKLSGKEEKEIYLKEIKLSTILHSYKAHLEQLHFDGSVLPLQVCKEILTTGELKSMTIDSKIKESHLPNDFNMVSYYLKSVWRRIAFHLNDLFRQEDWNVGYCNCPIEDFVSAKENEELEIHWFKKPRKNCYFADPFIIKTEKDTYIFFEWYSYSKGKADLAVARKSEDFKQYHILTNFKEHRSYPYVFSHEGTIYCMPEANQTNQVCLYRFNEEKLTVEKDCVLLDGFPIVDATLYHHENKWFMFLVNQKKSHSHLEIYYSDNLKGPYLPHHNNPVMIDCSKARPAGKIFSCDGRIIRPSQNSTSHYGESLILEEIEILSEKQFSTIPFKIIEPIENSDYGKGIHTINGDDNITVFDGKRFVFTMSGLKQQFKQKIRK